MNKIVSLTKVLLKTNLLSGAGESKNNKKKRKGLGLLGRGLLLLFVVCSLGIPIIFAFDSVLEILPIGNIFLSFILPLAGITTIVFSIFSVVSVFYLSKDSEHLLPLPIEPRDLMISKFLVSLVNEYYILFMFILPCLIGVGVGINAGILYYVYMILIFLLLPIIPSAIVTLIILIVTRFTGVMKNKDLFMYISMGLVLIFAFGYNYIVQNFISVDMDNIGTTVKSLEDAVLPYFRAIFPFYNSGVNALVNYDNIIGLFALVAFAAFNVIALLFIYLLGDKLYLKTLTVTKGNKKKIDIVEEVVGKKSKNKGEFYWLLKKEWLIVKRTPIFMLNIVIIVFLMPIIFIVSFLQEGGNISAIKTSNISIHLSNPLIYLIVLAVAIFFTCSSVAASTSISREGSSAWFMKVIPVSYFKQINAKVFFAVLLDILGVIMVGIIPVIVYKIPVYYVIGVLIPLVIIVVLLNYFNILLDLRKPRLNWSEESTAVKQNLNGLVSMLITIAVCAVFGIIAFLFYKYDVNINVMILSLVISLVSGIILFLVICWFYKNSDKLLDKVD